MKKGINVSLQTKIVGLTVLLIVIVIVLLASIFSYMQSIESKRQAEQLALQAAKSISFMPEVKEAFEKDNPSHYIQPLAEQVREQIGAATIIVENRQEIAYSHSNLKRIGEKNPSSANYRALMFGGYYTLEGMGSSGLVIMGKAPVIVDDGEYREVVGVVTVEFLKKDVNANLHKRIKQIIFCSLTVLLLGVLGGIFLAKSIKKDTLGLEPHEIASLYRERSAILHSIKEGIIAIDQKGHITMMNTSAKTMLGLEGDYLNHSIIEVFPYTNMMQVLEDGISQHDQEISFNDKTFILNLTPIVENSQIVGMVSSFRDKTELNNLINTISEVRKYSEDLRAQTHEFTNKLYVLSGLLQLGQYEEALEFIQKESNIHQTQSRILFDQILDAKVQAILLGKIGKASEKKVNFFIESGSMLKSLPEHIGISHLIIIIGNIIDNAFDAVSSQKDKLVTFFITDMGHDIIIEVTDNGKGINNQMIDQIFTKGFSTKGTNRGYGLANVKRMVDELQGSIEVHRQEQGGAIFSIYLPKNEGKVHKEGQTG
ncbi:sensor histidine kinase [Priestia megaterium]|nr:sensor histidine kinase [Priestia megaterium]